MQINMLEAKNQLSRLVKAALGGEEVIIANNGKPLVRLAPLEDRRFNRKAGLLKGKLVLPADWDSPAANREVQKGLTQGKLLP